MLSVSRKNWNRKTAGKEWLSVPFLVQTIMIIALVVNIFFNSTYKQTDYSVVSVDCVNGSSRSSNPDVDYKVDESCKNLPSIRPAGTYFLDEKIKGGASPEGIFPSFTVGSYFAQKVPYHMNGDKPNFALIKDALNGKEGQVVIDFGANQGFYTYYLAALGMQVHSFEINEANFKSLQHGAEYNPKEITDRIHLYPVGIGAKNARFGMKGNNYEGFLTEKAGPILGSTFDCFAYHTKNKLDLSKGVAFVKLDVEGHEIAVLQGAKHSLFRKGSTVGAMIVEVGPNRWGRAGIDFDTGVETMRNLADHFKKSYLLARGPGTPYAKTCPLTLAQDLSDKTPRKFEGHEMYQVGTNEWENLLKKMEENGFDCNFFYQN